MGWVTLLKWLFAELCFKRETDFIESINFLQLLCQVILLRINFLQLSGSSSEHSQTCSDETEEGGGREEESW